MDQITVFEQQGAIELVSDRSFILASSASADGGQRVVISNDAAPKAIGPYSQAIRASICESTSLTS